MDQVHCKCGNLLAEAYGLPLEQRTPCPHCGSISRAFTKELPATVTIAATLEGVGRRPGFKSGARKRPFVEFIEGWVPSVAYGRVKKSWMLNRAERRYTERVELEDGSVIKDVREDLTDHTGHGSDKPKA